MVPQPVARAQFSLGTNLNTPFSHFFLPEFGPSARAWVQDLHRVHGH